MPKAVLFDLDGTLVQARDSSWRLFAKTNEAFDLGVRAPEEYFRLFEGNLMASLRELVGEESLYRKVLAHFLDLLRKKYNPPLVPGMVDVIKSMAGVCSLTVVSSNATEAIRRILTTAGVQHCFSHVFGGDVEPDKRACVRRFLSDPSYSVNRQCVPAYLEEHQPDSPSESQVVLVTDTVGDVRHALECGIRAVGVAWGMHTEAQLREAGAEFVAIWPQEIVAHLFPGGIEMSSHGTSCGFVGHQHESAGADVREDACGCGCASSAGAPGPREAALQGELAHSSSIRRNRSRAAIEALGLRLDASSNVKQAAPEMHRASDILVSSLARIRGGLPRAS